VSEPRKKVLIWITAEHILEVPHDWDEEMVNFFLNDSSHCICNDLLDAAESHFRNDNTNSWLDVTGTYVREATDADLALLEGDRQLS
jgi:hypothetical protein